ncbi:MAG: teichoic acid D-Ala incorporation-associated protein DltX [Clostridiales Family XIII bacterium]|nr:teichoic acid D-Ala incorporation-associated protein DltX [Clostridiales Family XIII bacterium]
MKTGKYKTVAVIAAKTLFYTAILLFLIYLYHYRQIGTGAFIYDEF